MNNKNHFAIFAAAALAYCLIMALCFEPVTDKALGDSPDYIELAKQFAGISTDHKELNARQPLYSMFIAPFIVWLGEERFVYPVMYLQFLMVFLSALLIYKLFERLQVHRALPAVAAALHLLSFATVFHAYNILSETLSQLIFIGLAYTLVVSADKDSAPNRLLLGLLAGLAVLARFNLVGLPLVLIVCLLMIHYRHYGLTRWATLGRSLGLYVFALALVLNAWCLYNYTNRGYYGLFPPYHAGQRWAVPSTITEENTATAQYQDVLAIFVKARNQYLANGADAIQKKGSFLRYKFFSKLNEMMQPTANGYHIYLMAEPELLTYYGLDNTAEGIYALSGRLLPFYKEITDQNRKELLRLRMYSLFGTFRAVGITLPVDEKINLNKLPAPVIQLYKILMLAAFSGLFLVAFFHFVARITRIRSYAHWRVLLLIMLIAYFPAVHFYANVLHDANRFKFPAESLMLGLVAFYGFEFFRLLGKKRIFSIFAKA